MSRLATVKVLWHLARGGRGTDHAERLDDFYDGQAEHYDGFRERFLHGRGDLIAALDLPAGAVVADFGGGTGRNLEFYGDRLRSFERIDLVDLCRPLLAVAEGRCRQHGWDNVHLHHADVTRFRPRIRYDAITFSYSLSMIPDWWQAIDQAIALLRPGGRLGVVDFHVSRQHPRAGGRRHGAWTRTVWPAWFRRDGVHLREDLLPYLQDHLVETVCEERRGRLPLTPFRVPHLVFVGRRPGGGGADGNGPGCATGWWD